MTFGDLISIARELKGWTQRDLEKASGVNNALICQIETGKIKDTSFSNAIKLADALGLSLDRAASTVRSLSQKETAP